MARMLITQKCSEHPRYKGTKPPKNDCEICWKIYNAIHPKCNMCSKDLGGEKVNKGRCRTHCFEMPEKIEISHIFGYNSKRDTQSVKFALCEDCFEKIVNQLEIPPTMTHNNI